MVRSAHSRLPGAGQPIDFDQPPFVTKGFGPDGSIVRYYNFDVQNALPATRYRFVRVGSHDAIAGQLDVIDVLPGDVGYSDFWQIARVEVAPDFQPGSVTGVAQIAARQLRVIVDATAVDCPVVPIGSTARFRIGDEAAEPEEVWFRGRRVSCLRFGGSIALDDRGQVPTSHLRHVLVEVVGREDGLG